MLYAQLHGSPALTIVLTVGAEEALICRAQEKCVRACVQVYLELSAIAVLHFQTASPQPTEATLV